jgi:hypothetical protein
MLWLCCALLSQALLLDRLCRDNLASLDFCSLANDLDYLFDGFCIFLGRLASGIQRPVDIRDVRVDEDGEKRVGTLVCRP